MQYKYFEKLGQYSHHASVSQIGEIIPIDIGIRFKVVIRWEEVGEKCKNRAWGGKMVLE